MIQLEIDRIVLDGFDIGQGRAENIKSLLQAELKGRMSHIHSIPEMRPRDLSHIKASIEPLEEQARDDRIACNIAESIMISIFSAKNPG